HHAMIDGIAGVDIAQVLFDVTPEPAVIPHPDAPWQPAREPSPAELLAAGTAGLLRTRLRAATQAAAGLRPPHTPLSLAPARAVALGEVAWAGRSPAAEPPLDVELGPPRRYEVVRTQLDDFKLVKNAFGGTVNDVVLAVVSGALREWLRGRGVRTEGLELRAL